jgi:acetylornithine aminotransferase
MFAHQHQGITPDVMTLAKALGNGVPIGACLAAGRAVGLLGPGSHGSTFGGNPLACRAGIAVMETLAGESLPARAGELGRHLLERFSERLSGLPGVTEIRGRGLMIGIELDRPCAALVGEALAAGLLINVTAERVVRLLPPLTMTDEEAERLVAGVSERIETFLSAD